MIRLFRRLEARDGLLTLICVALVACQVFLDLRLPDYTKEITLLISTETKAMAEYFAAGGKMLLCALASALLAVVVGFLSVTVAADFGYTIRGKVFAKVSEFGSGEFGEFTTASLITRSTNDISQIRVMVAMGLQMAMKAPIMAVWAVAKIVGKSWELSALTAVAVVALMISVLIILSIVLPKFKIVQRQIDDVNRVMRENLTGLRVIRAFNAERGQEEKFDGVSEALMRTQLFTSRTLVILFPVMTLIQSLLTLSIYWVGSYLINAIEIPLTGSLADVVAGITARANLLGDVVVFNSYAIYVIMSFLMLMAIFMFYPRAQVSAGRINEVLDARVAVVEGSGEKTLAPAGTIEFRDVSFRYPDAAQDCLSDITFTALPGETVAVIGATGSGKSTLVGLAARLFDVTEGQVLIDGVDVREYSFKSLYQKMGYVPQRAQLFADSVRANVAYGDAGHEITDDDVAWALDVAQATDFVTAMDGGVETAVAQGGANLSGGQRQRLSIARAIARRPEVLVFDDSFSALDYKTDRALRQRLSSDLAGTTCVIVAQRIATIRGADKIVVLDEGKVAGIGTHDELMEGCEVYREIAFSQLSAAELGQGV